MNDDAVTAAGLIGWQTLLADLSLILFMVTAAAMAGSQSASTNRPAHPLPAPAEQRCDTALGEPLALWRAGGSQTLAHWLASEEPDERQQLTITAHYRKGGESQALAAAQALVGQAGAMGQAARVIIAPASGSTGDQTLASLAYDRTPESGTAQDLLGQTAIPADRNPP